MKSAGSRRVRMAVPASDPISDAVRNAASGSGVLPPDLLGELLKHVERLQREILAPNGLDSAGLSTREIHALHLMAEGMDTMEIARELRCSRRNAKNIVHGLSTA